MTKEELARKAVEAMGHAYAPYSGYLVGAALLTADGTVYQGCNIENASFTPTVCAERTAFFKAIYDGKRDFRAIAVVGGKGGTVTGFFPPCGVCRQVMREFCRPDQCLPGGVWRFRWTAGPDGGQVWRLSLYSDRFAGDGAVEAEYSGDPRGDFCTEGDL